MTIGEHMKAAHLSRGLTRLELSRMADVSEGCIMRCENNNGFPSLIALMSLADALGVSIDEYIGRTPTVYVKKYTKTCGNCQHCVLQGIHRKCHNQESEFYQTEIKKTDTCEHWQNYDLEMYGEEINA